MLGNPITGLKKKRDEIEDNKEDACRKRKRPTPTETVNLLTWNMQGGGMLTGGYLGNREIGRNENLNDAPTNDIYGIPTWSFLPYINHSIGIDNIQIFCLQEVGNIDSLVENRIVKHITQYNRTDLGNGRYLQEIHISVLFPSYLRDLEEFREVADLVLYGYYWHSGGRRVNLVAASTTPPNNHHLLPNPAGDNWRPILGIQVDGKWYYTIHHSRSQHGNHVLSQNGFLNQAHKPCIIAGDYNHNSYLYDSPLILPTDSPTHHARGLTSNINIDEGDIIQEGIFDPAYLQSHYDYAIKGNSQNNDQNFTDEQANVVSWELQVEGLDTGSGVTRYAINPAVGTPSSVALDQLVAALESLEGQGIFLGGNLNNPNVPNDHRDLSMRRLIPSDHHPVVYTLFYNV